jgi:type IV secretion system protein VirB6
VFFQNFMAWLAAQLHSYVSVQVAKVAAAVAPVAVSIATLYVMTWGYLQLRGAIAEPLLEGVRRVVTLAIVLGVALHLWLYHDVLVATFLDGPSQLAAAMVGAADPVATVDVIWEQGGAVGDTLWNRGGLFNGDPGYYLAGAAVWVVVGLVCVYCVFLLALSQIAAAILLALGPLFLLALLFDRTRHLFEGWIAQLINYGLIALLLTLVAGLLLQLIAAYARQTAALGAALATLDVLNLLLATCIVFLLLRQVPPIAAGLARGMALSTMGAVGVALAAGLRPLRLVANRALAAALGDRGAPRLGPTTEPGALVETVDRRLVPASWQRDGE